MIGDAQGRGALCVGIESGGVDEDLAAQLLAGAGLQLQIGVDAVAFALGDLLDLIGHLIEREAGVRIEGHAGQRVGGGLLAVADDGKLVVHRLVAGTLQGVVDVMVDEGRFAGAKSTQNRNQRPPGDLRGERVVARKQSHAEGDVVQHPEALDGAQQYRVLLFQVGFEVV